jgi:hypothetical protein
MPRAKIGPTIHVIFETSCLFVDAADKLISTEISEFVLAANEGIDLTVHWYIPQLVREERKYQMRLRAERLLPQLAKVETLLGHNLGITKEILINKVDDVIEREVQRHALVVRELDPRVVDWQALIQRAVNREAPFSATEKQEKGFRDAIILETVCQLVEELPKAPQTCRIVFVCADSLLGQAAQERTLGRANVVITSELSELKTILNALASQLTEEMLTKILPTAAVVFADFRNKQGLLWSGKIIEKIEHEHRAALRSAPWPGAKIAILQRLVAHPAFLSKQGQTLRFSSRITFKMQARTTSWIKPTASEALASSPPLGAAQGMGLLGDLPGILGTAPPQVFASAGTAPTSDTSSLGNFFSSTPPGLLGDLGPLATAPRAEEIIHAGEHVFEVTWCATLTARGKLTRAKVEGIEHKAGRWDESS